MNILQTDVQMLSDRLSPRIRQWLRRLQIIGILTLIAVALAVPQSRSLLNENAGAVTGILSLLLVVLYFGQYRLHSEQLELENRSVVDIEEYEEDGSDLRVFLSNLGNGVAANLQIETEVEFEATKNVTPAVGIARLRKVGDEGDRKSRVGNTLKAGAQNVWFVGKPRMTLEVDGRTQDFGLGAGMDRLRQEDEIDEVKFKFYVKNKDLLGNVYRESVYGGFPFVVGLGEDIPRNIEEIKLEGRFTIEIED